MASPGGKPRGSSRELTPFNIPLSSIRQRVAKLATPTLLVLLTAEEGRYDRSEILCTKTLYNDVDLGLLHIKNIDLPQKLSRNTKIHKPRVLRSGACTIAEVLAET